MATSDLKAKKLHDEALVFNMLTLPDVLEEPFFGKMKKGGVDAIICTAAITNDFKQSMENIEELYEKVERLNNAVVTTKVSEIEDAKNNNKLSVIIGFQDSTPIENELTKYKCHLKSFYRVGVRCIQLTYTGGNAFGTGCGELNDTGVTFLGKALIEELNSLGILIDLSHSGQKTTIEATELSEKPVAYTHANCITICNNNRNKNDDCLKKLAEKNGIIGINALPKAVKKDPPRSVEDLIDHVDYLKKLIGINHIGIGLDLVEGMKKKKVMPTESVFWRSRRPDMFGSVDDFFDMSYPDGIQSAEEIPNITKGLVERGYSKSDIQKILGLNTLRVLRETIG